MPDDASHSDSASVSLSNSANALSTPTNQNVHDAGGKAQRLAIGLVFIQLAYKVSDRGIEFVLKLFETMLKIIAQFLLMINQLLLNELPKTVY